MDFRYLLINQLKRVRRHIPFQNSAYRLLKILNMPERWHKHLQIHGWISIATKTGNFRMFSEGDIIENTIFWSRDGRGDNSMSFQAWENIAAISDGMILDIGANTGLFALIAKTVRCDATVVAFEPVRRIANKLSRNILANNYDIDVIEKAVSDRNGNATFFDSADPLATTNAYSASLEESFAINDQSYPVAVVALDNFISYDQHVSLIKIDVEMHEVSAIRGMIGIIERNRPSILIEILNDSIGSDVTDLLMPFGYSFFRIDETAGLQAADRLGPTPGHNFNNLACMPNVVKDAHLSELILSK